MILAAGASDCLDTGGKRDRQQQPPAEKQQQQQANAAAAAAAAAAAEESRGGRGKRTRRGAPGETLLWYHRMLVSWQSLIPKYQWHLPDQPAWAHVMLVA
jgi:hypothetical protein